MERTTRMILTGIVGVLGAVVLIGLLVFPFQYGVVESTILAGAFVCFALFEFVLNETSF